MTKAASAEMASNPASRKPSVAGKISIVPPMKRAANRGPVNGISAVQTSIVASARAASSRSKAAKVGEEITGGAPAWRMSARNRPGASAGTPENRKANPNTSGIASIVQSAAAMTRQGRRR